MPYRDPEAKKANRREWYLANRERILAKMTQYRADNPEQVSETKKRCYLAKKEVYNAKSKHWYRSNRDKSIADSAKWASDNRERSRSIKSRYRNADIERAREQARRWAANNPLSRIKHKHLRRARENEVPGSWSKADILKLLEDQHFLCPDCRCRIGHRASGAIRKYHIDHIEPIARGNATNGVENLRLTCGHCNQSKSATDPYRYAQSKLGRLFI